MDRLAQLQLSSLSLSFPKTPPQQMLKPLALLGALYTSHKLYALASFAWQHFLRTGSLDRYLQPTSPPSSSGESEGNGRPWALVTGASAGIGKGFVYELASRGFNVVLHGRNEAKLYAEIEDLEKQWPEREFKVLVLDVLVGARDVATMENAVERVRGLNLRVLINNVAGGEGDGPLWLPLPEMPGSTVDDWVDASARFPTQLTRCLLPSLTASKAPALVVNIGSGISEMPAPFLTVYSGAKAFNMAWSRSLAAEMRAQGEDLEVMGVLVGTVATEKAGRGETAMAPAPRRFARACLGRVGCGEAVLWAWWAHEVVFEWVIGGVFPRWVTERLVGGIAMGAREKEMRGEKAF